MRSNWLNFVECISDVSEISSDFFESTCINISNLQKHTENYEHLKRRISDVALSCICICIFLYAFLYAPILAPLSTAPILAPLPDDRGSTAPLHFRSGPRMDDDLTVAALLIAT